MDLNHHHIQMQNRRGKIAFSLYNDNRNYQNLYLDLEVLLLHLLIIPFLLTTVFPSLAFCFTITL